MSRFDIPEGSHNLVVGGRPCALYDDPDKCTHTERNVCPQCTELTEAEAQAIREYLAGLGKALVRQKKEADRHGE